MSLILPNGARIAPTTTEGFNEIARHVREKIPIVVTSEGLDGEIEETVLWHPDDPGVADAPAWLRPARRGAHVGDDLGVSRSAVALGFHGPKH